MEKIWHRAERGGHELTGAGVGAVREGCNKPAFICLSITLFKPAVRERMLSRPTRKDLEPAPGLRGPLGEGKLLLASLPGSRN